MILKFGKNYGEINKTPDKQKYHCKNKKKLAKNIKPISMENKNDMFIRFFPFKMKMAVILHRLKIKSENRRVICPSLLMKKAKN